MTEKFINLKELVIQNYNNNKDLTEKSLNEYLENLVDEVNTQLNLKFKNEEYKYKFVMHLNLITTILSFYAQKSLTPEAPISVDELNKQFIALSSQDDFDIKMMKSFYFYNFTDDVFNLKDDQKDKYNQLKDDLYNSYENIVK